MSWGPIFIGWACFIFLLISTSFQVSLNSKPTMQNQLLTGALKIECFENFYKTLRKTLVIESCFRTAAVLKHVTLFQKNFDVVDFV